MIDKMKGCDLPPGYMEALYRSKEKLGCWLSKTKEEKDIKKTTKSNRILFNIFILSTAICNI